MNKQTKPTRGVITEQGDLGLGMNAFRRKDQEIIDNNKRVQENKDNKSGRR